MSIDLASKKGRLLIMALLLVIFLLGMALRLEGLDADSLWLDEITTHFRGQFDIPSLMAHMTSAPAALDQGPLIYLVTHFSVAYLADSDFILRLQALLFGSLSVLLAYNGGGNPLDKTRGPGGGSPAGGEPLSYPVLAGSEAL